jgi:hypothetical protein
MEMDNPNEVIMIPNADIAQKPDLGPTSAPDNDKLQPLVDHCKELQKAFEGSVYRQEKIKEIEDSHKVYEQKETEVKTELWDGQSNITLPLTAITVDNLEPRLVSGLVGRDPLVRFEMIGTQEQDDAIKITESWFNQELENEIKVKTVARDVIHLNLLEGTWFGITKYNQEKLVRRDFKYTPDGQIMAPNGIPEWVDVEDILFEGGEVENVPFSDILCADNLGSIKDWERADVGMYVRPTYSELMLNKDQYLANKIGPWLIPNKTNLKKADADMTPDDRVSGVEVTGKEVIKCINWYISYPVGRIMNDTDDKPEEEQSDFIEERIIATIAVDSGVLIRLALLREFNFSNEHMIRRVRLFSEPGRSFGTSMYGKMKAIQNGTSDFFNTVINISILCMIPWFFYEDSSGIKSETEVHPGKGIPVDSIKGVMIPDFFKLNPGNYLQFIEIFMRLWEQLGSISNPQIGRPDDKQKTATEIMAVIQEGNIKYDYQANTTKEEFLSIVRVLYDLYYQHMPFNKTFNYNGEEVPIPRKLLRQRYKFVLSGSTASANKMIERKEAEEILMMAQGNPLMNPMTALEDVLKAYGKTDLKQYINPEARALLEKFFANPDLMQAVDTYLGTKQQIAEQVGVDTEGGNKPNAQVANNMKKMQPPGMQA